MLIATSVYLLVFAGPAHAFDFEHATAAYNAGDYTTALVRFRALAAHGHVVAQANLSIMYFHGIGVARDEAKAIEWAARAADQGYPVAQAQLGFIYLNATGPGKDAPRAAQWYRRAAERGYDVAQATLGTLLFQGIGVGQDHRAAVTWFRLAAEQGNPDALAKLGVAYVRGDGVAADTAQAYLCFHAAARFGKAGLANIIDFLAAQLAAGDIARARRAAADCQAPDTATAAPGSRGGIEQGALVGRDLYPDRYR